MAKHGKTMLINNNAVGSSSSTGLTFKGCYYLKCIQDI